MGNENRKEPTLLDQKCIEYLELIYVKDRDAMLACIDKFKEGLSDEEVVGPIDLDSDNEKYVSNVLRIYGQTLASVAMFYADKDRLKLLKNDPLLEAVEGYPCDI